MYSTVDPHNVSTTSTLIGMGSCTITNLVPHILESGASLYKANGATYGNYKFW